MNCLKDASYSPLALYRSMQLSSIHLVQQSLATLRLLFMHANVKPVRCKRHAWKQPSHHSMVFICTCPDGLLRKTSYTPLHGADTFKSSKDFRKRKRLTIPWCSYPFIATCTSCVLLTVPKWHSCDIAAKACCSKSMKKVRKPNAANTFQSRWWHLMASSRNAIRKQMYRRVVYHIDLHTLPRTLEYFGCNSFSTGRLAGFH